MEGEVPVAQSDTFSVKIKGQGEFAADPPLFSNFVAISRAAREVQFEFVFLDLNYIAQLLQTARAGGLKEIPEVEGQTVAKIVMPAAVFLQLREHLNKMFDDIEKIVKTSGETPSDQIIASNR
jgi:hypothetical protein